MNAMAAAMHTFEMEYQTAMDARYAAAARMIFIATALTSSLQAGAASMIRVACEGENSGAQISTTLQGGKNEQFKGECPVDFEVPPGRIWINAKKAGDLQVRVFGIPLDIGDGVVKKVEVDFGDPIWGRVEYTRKGADAIKRRAEAGDAGAQSTLGEIYFLGDPYGRDYELSLKWYRRAAEQGSSEAMQSLGDFYYSGKYGVAQDTAEARRWYQKAVHAGGSGARLAAIMLKRIEAGE